MHHFCSGGKLLCIQINCSGTSGKLLFYGRKLISLTRREGGSFFVGQKGQGLSFVVKTSTNTCTLYTALLNPPALLSPPTSAARHMIHSSVLYVEKDVTLS